MAVRTSHDPHDYRRLFFERLLCSWVIKILTPEMDVFPGTEFFQIIYKHMTQRTVKCDRSSAALKILYECVFRLDWTQFHVATVDKSQTRNSLENVLFQHNNYPCRSVGTDRSVRLETIVTVTIAHVIWAYPHMTGIHKFINVCTLHPFNHKPTVKYSDTHKHTHWGTDHVRLWEQSQWVIERPVD